MIQYFRLALAVLSVGIALPAGQAAEVPRPNIIMVLIDDMGWADLSCFGGKGVSKNIDRLAAEGIKFTRFYVNMPICSPSRVAITTGQYPHRWRITSYLDNRKMNETRGMAQWLDPKAPVLARELQRAGYATGHYGKWHMGGQRDVGEAPLPSAYGFDESLVNFEGLGARVLPLCDAYDGTEPKKHDLGSGNLEKGPIAWVNRSFVTAEYVKGALGFISRAQAAGKPFFLNLWPDDVHSPFFPPRELRQATDGSKRALYLAVLQAMDEQLGPLFERVRNDPKLRENTLILVASDNGPEPGAGSAGILRGTKGMLYEGGVRSPLIAWSPGLLAKEARGITNSEAMLSAMDLNRSLYSITGTALPANTVLDGEDVSATLLGKAKKGRQNPLFWRRPPDRPGTPVELWPDLAAWDGPWKFYNSYAGAAPQLYNLDTDISETQNVAAQHPEITARLAKAVQQWNAGLPTDAGPTTKPVSESGPPKKAKGKKGK